MNLQVIENIDLYQLLQAAREADRERSNCALQCKNAKPRSCIEHSLLEMWEKPKLAYARGGRECKYIASSSVLHPSSGFDSRPERESVDHKNSLSHPQIPKKNPAIQAGS